MPASFTLNKTAEAFDGSTAKGHAAGILFVAPDGEVLLLRRGSEEANFAGHWALPGGKVEEGETPAAGAARETKEEIGLDIAEPSKIVDQRMTPTGMAFHTFAVPSEEKFSPTLNEEHNGYAWFSLGALPNPMHPAVQKTIDERLLAKPANDMSPEEWRGLRDGFAKWTREEAAEAEHAQDSKLAMDRNLYDAHGKRIMGADRIALDRSASVRSYDADGHLHVARTPISKANVCEYYGHEIPGADELGLEPQRKYRLLRDPEELKKGAASANGKPLMIKHVPTSADDHQGDLVVGSIGTDAEYKHPYLFNSLTVWDRKGIDGIEDKSQTELSSAYRYRADMTPGTYEGAQFDGVMRDIDFNHVALVPEGRAGADVVVGDSKPHGEVLMSKILLTRKGTYMAGALANYLGPKIAQDSKFDVTAVFNGVTAKNFKAKKAKIAEYIKNKVELAADANIDDLIEVLDKLDGQAVAEGADIDPSSGLPMTAAAVKAEDGDDDEAAAKAEAMKARAEKLEAYKKAQGMDEEACKAFDELMGDLDGMDSDEPKVEAAPAKTPVKEEEPKMVTKEAMDAALKTVREETQASTLRTANEIFEAKELASKWVGRLAMDATASSDVYKLALDHLKVDVTDVHPSAFKKILEAQPLPGAAAAAAEMANDGMPDVVGLEKRFGKLTDRITVVS